MPLPFEVEFSEVSTDIDSYVDSVFESLDTEFLIMPKGRGFIEYRTFDNGYEALKSATRSFSVMTVEAIAPAVFAQPIAFVVLRCILGLTPPEWASIASQRGDVNCPQGAVRDIDRRIRLNPDKSLNEEGVTADRIRALISVACQTIRSGVPSTSDSSLHRFDKIDTKAGQVSLKSAATLGIPYSMLLYERLLGRPFASHRDSVSELVGDLVENAVASVLSRNKISFQPTANAERLAGFDQAPDFVIPNEQNPQVVIEAKLSEDDGTARDKITRIQHLASIADSGGPHQPPRFELVACIAGRGFGVRREDMKKLLIATRGKVFTLQNIAALVEHTRLREYRAA